MCTRTTYFGPNDMVITTCTLDWVAPMPINLWVLPEGLPRDGAAGPEALRWTSR